MITAFISPYRDDRAVAREILGPERFVETYLAADLGLRTPRSEGLYRKARAGEIPDFTGISAPYEAPDDPTIKLDTGVLSVEQSIGELLGVILPRLRDGHAGR